MNKEWNVLDIIDLNTVITHIKAANKDEALKTMADRLMAEGYLTDTDKFLQDVYKREQEGCTGIGNYIAIPHGKSAAVKKIGVAIATVDEEISWETLDGQGVKVIVLFAVGDSDTDAQTHLKLLSLFARKLGRDEVVSALLAADTAADVKAAFTH